jgi:proteasome beta subunit
MAFQFMPGATAVGISYQDGVVLGAEKRISYGNFVVNKNTRKTFSVRQVVALAKIRKLETRRNIAPNSIAKLMSVIMFERRFFPLLTQVIVGGIEIKPEIYTLDPLGSVLPDDYAAVGTGAELALGILDSEYSHNISEEKAKDITIKSIKSSIQRDASSGDGIDLLFITTRGLREESMAF